MYIHNDALERTEGQFVDEERLAKKVLLWITCTKRLLTIFELEDILTSRA